MARHRNLLALASQLEHLLGALVLGEALEEQRAHLALEFAHGPAFSRGFDLVEGAGLWPGDP